MACCALLLKLEQRGYITLPGRHCPGRGSRKVTKRGTEGVDISGIAGEHMVRRREAIPGHHHLSMLPQSEGGNVPELAVPKSRHSQ